MCMLLALDRPRLVTTSGLGRDWVASLASLPDELLVVRRGRRHPRIEAYWDGLAYIAL
jgi:hypothetical protein